jgi:probable HAF family extracellular repeat protein
MKSPRIVKLVLFGVVVFGGVERTFADVIYSFTRIDVPGSTSTQAYGINDSSQILGVVAGHGFLYSDGTFTAIDYPGAYTVPHGINDSGQVVGSFYDGANHGFLYSSGTYTTVDYPGAGLTSLNGINDSGQIVGQSIFNGAEHGFLYSGAAFTTIDYPGAPDTEAWGINDSGQIVGVAPQRLAGGDHGFLYSGGVFTTIDHPESCCTFAQGINDSGQIVGWFHDQAFAIRGFLYVGGSFATIDYPGATATYAFGINDGGQIVGWFQDATGQQHGFLAVPAVVPEPGSLPLLPVCLIGLGAMARHRKRSSAASPKDRFLDFPWIAEIICAKALGEGAKSHIREVPNPGRMTRKQEVGPAWGPQLPNV